MTSNSGSVLSVYSVVRIGFLFLFFSALVPVQSEEAPGIAAPVRFGDCLETFTYTGEMEASESLDLQAPDLREIRLMTIKSVLEDGTHVKKGEPVVQIDDAGFQISLEAATNELNLAKAELERTRFELQNEAIDLDLNIQRQTIELAKAKAMVVEGSVVISRVDQEKAKLGVELAQLELDQAKKARDEFEKKRSASMKVQELKVEEAQRKIRIQRENIEKASILAPRDGIVYKPFVKLNNEMGRIEANKVVRPGDKLLELPNLDEFQGILYIPASDYPFLKPGDPASVTLGIAIDTPVPGKVLKKELYPVSRNERLGRNDPEGYIKEYKIILELPEKNPLFRPGLTFQAIVACTVATDCLFIPRCAVTTSKDDPASAVWVKGAAGPVKRPIKPGRGGILFLEILSGLSRDEQVYLDYPGDETATATAE